MRWRFQPGPSNSTPALKPKPTRASQMRESSSPACPPNSLLGLDPPSPPSGGCSATMINGDLDEVTPMAAQGKRGRVVGVTGVRYGRPCLGPTGGWRRFVPPPCRPRRCFSATSPQWSACPHPVLCPLPEGAHFGSLNPGSCVIIPYGCGSATPPILMCARDSFVLCDFLIIFL